MVQWNPLPSHSSSVSMKLPVCRYTYSEVPHGFLVSSTALVRTSEDCVDMAVVVLDTSPVVSELKSPAHEKNDT